MIKMGRKLLFLIAFIFLMTVLQACSNKIDTNMSKPMDDFTLITQDEETLSLDDLKGHWWLAYLSYTKCHTVCPRTTTNMVNIQSKLKDDDLHPHIISFNVDPDHDGPAELRAYAEEYNVDLTSWDFLTGYNFETIQNLSKNTFDAVLEKGAVGQMSHSYMFYLVNPDGDVIKQYDGMGENDLKLLIDDVKTVLN